MRKAAFLDRDGVINEDKGYVYRWQDFKFIPGTINSLKRLKELGYALVIVTNQSGLARGYYTEREFHYLNAKINQYLIKNGVVLDKIYYCPHHPKGHVRKFSINCECRKPAPGMILRAKQELDLCLQGSILFGDKCSDGQAAQAAGIGRAYLIGPDASNCSSHTEVFTRKFETLESCVEQIFSKPKLKDL